MEEVLEKAEERNMMETYMAPSRREGGGGGSGGDMFGFVVKDAPWNAANGRGKPPAPSNNSTQAKQADFMADAGNDNEFPDLGLKAANGSQKPWGPWGGR